MNWLMGLKVNIVKTPRMMVYSEFCHTVPSSMSPKTGKKHPEGLCAAYVVTHFLVPVDWQETSRWTVVCSLCCLMARNIQMDCCVQLVLSDGKKHPDGLLCAACVVWWQETSRWIVVCSLCCLMARNIQMDCCVQLVLSDGKKHPEGLLCAACVVWLLPVPGDQQEEPRRGDGHSITAAGQTTHRAGGGQPGQHSSHHQQQRRRWRTFQELVPWLVWLVPECACNPGECTASQRVTNVSAGVWNFTVCSREWRQACDHLWRRGWDRYRLLFLMCAWLLVEDELDGGGGGGGYEWCCWYWL